MSYVDGFVCAVPTDKRDEYQQHAVAAAQLFKKYGAERVVETWGNDVPDGEVTSFPLAVQCKQNETVVFSWIQWPSKAARDEGMAKFMKDPFCDPKENPMPFDGKRLIYGGFETIVDC
ncbi:DUF1428 domain-containing protein [Photobacterium sp. CCB-ST2H9]|uniref:DUF1428 domain-containing protein n=1 Tax=Photobacterium sp. CCB-ST2H9 TaxID=2912855 RepID=UPI002003EFE1|nr:DUF1428 domain-containing protein [Photobacterium sp. CCB-ST2H9]UTM58589.1 DUF1428 domain-containing protein [Photobacterium sp. CCB-ST2H9]